MALLLLVACRPDPSPPPAALTDTGSTATSTTADTAGAPTSSTGDTGPVVPPLACAVEHDVGSGILGDAWLSPTGTLYAVGPQAPRVRAADGTWTLDPLDTAMAGARDVHGSADDEVWALTSGAALRRLKNGSWQDMGAPASVHELEAVHVFGTDDVLILKVDDLTCHDCPTRQTPILLRWDGTTWDEDALPTVNGSVFDMDVLADGSVVIAAAGGLRVAAPSPAPIATPPGLYVRQVHAAPDGTLVAVGDGGGVAVGTVAGGLVSTDPGVVVNEWNDVWAASATDIWLSGTWWESGIIPWAVVVHYDGATWSPVLVDHPAGQLRLAGGAGQIFAVGGSDHEVVLVGDAGGLTLEREGWGVDLIRELVRDDVTGKVWAAGWGSVLGVYEAGAWRGEPLPDRGMRADRIAASGDRLAISAFDELYVYEGGVLTPTQLPGGFYYWLAGGGSVLFAAGSDASGDLDVRQESGAGWQPIDLTGLPVGAEASALWADGPNELWLGLETGGGGALAHWDGASWTQVLTGLSTEPTSITRGADGLLYYTQFVSAAQGLRTLWSYDGATATVVPDLVPDVRTAHVVADGTLFVSVIAEDAYGDLYGRLMQRAPGGTWIELLTDGGVIPLTGSADTVWAAREGLGWVWGPCPP